jgi:hypothetical protein
MIENIKPAESLTLADFEAHPVWEFLNDDEIGETMVRPVEKIPVESLDNRIVLDFSSRMERHVMSIVSIP